MRAGRSRARRCCPRNALRRALTSIDAEVSGAVGPDARPVAGWCRQPSPGNDTKGDCRAHARDAAQIGRRARARPRGRFRGGRWDNVPASACRRVGRGWGWAGQSVVTRTSRVAACGVGRRQAQSETDQAPSRTRTPAMSAPPAPGITDAAHGLVPPSTATGRSGASALMSGTRRRWPMAWAVPVRESAVFLRTSAGRSTSDAGH